MKRLSPERCKLHMDALKEARKQRDACNGSVWSNLVKQLGEQEAELVMCNLMWLDKQFMPPLKKG